MKKYLILVFVLILAITASVYAEGSTSPLCTIEEFEQQKTLNSELYESCKANDGAFLCLHNPEDDKLSVVCRALSRVDEPKIESEKGLYPVQNIEIDGSRTEWFLDWFSFYTDPLNLPTVEDREKAKTESPELYKFCMEKEETFIVRYDSQDKKILTECRVLQQDPINPATIECDGNFPIQNYVHKTGAITPWFCDTGSMEIPVTVFQNN